MIRIVIDFDAQLTNREATGLYDETLPEPTDEAALDAMQEALHEKGPTRFLADYGLIETADIQIVIDRPNYTEQLRERAEKAEQERNQARAIALLFEPYVDTAGCRGADEDVLAALETVKGFKP